jgi:hypothetical protein
MREAASRTDRSSGADVGAAETAAPMRKARVETAKAAPPFQAALENARRRNEAGKFASETKRAGLLVRLESLEVEVPDIPRERLVRIARDHYNALQWARARWDSDSAPRDRSMA